MSTDLVINSAHSTGKTCLAFSSDGSTVYTGGRDSLVRIWETDGGGDQEPDVALEAEDAITSLTSSSDGGSWFSASLDGHVRQYAKARNDMQSLVTRTAGVPIRCIACDPKGKKLAVASDETTIRIIDIEDPLKIQILQGHKRGVRNVSWHPSEDLLASCGADGKIIVWNCSTEEVKIEKELDGFLPILTDTESEDYERDCPAVWHTSGQYFIVATTAHEIITISRNTWSKVSTFSEEDSNGAITSLALSVNGVYLASASKSGILVWSTSNRRVITRHSTSPDVSVYQLAFSPKHNLLAWTDNEGVLTRWRAAIPPSAPSPTKLVNIGLSVPVRRQPTPLFGEEPETRKDGDLVDEDNVNDDAPDDDWIIDDLDGGLEDKPDLDFGVGGLREMVSVTRAQPSFQPGSTPFVNKRRYLAFNNIGVVEVVDQEMQQIINVEFFDQSTRKNYHFTDHFKYTLAAVGERGVAYACQPENDNGAQVTYKPYSTWATHGEWTYTLPKGVNVLSIAAGGSMPIKSLRTPVEADIEGNGYVAVATNKNEIRFFSGGGIQTGPIWAVDGDVVAMVAARDYIFVVHREGGASLDGNQNLKYTLKTSDTFRIMHTGRLPINKGHTLKWIGISDEGAPIIYDSMERLMILQHFRFTSQGSWVVLLDATTLERRIGKDESYWPVGVTKSTLMCIILKGREEHPGFPRPLVQELEMKMPYLGMDSPEAQKEERVARESMLLDSIRDSMEEDMLTTDDISRTELDMDKEIIVLIQLAVKNDKLQRALDATKLLHHTASFDMAAKVAEFYHLSGLQEKIYILKEAREASDRLRDDRDKRREWRSASGPIHPAPRENYSDFARSTRTPFQDSRPTPAIARTRLTVATPLAEPSPFSNNARTIVPDTPMRKPDENSPPSAEGKRKRDQLPDELDEDLGYDSGAKRRTIETTNATNGTKPNPFAKKVKPSENDNHNANPFLRKLTANKSLHKSESFFDKVNAAEDEAEQSMRFPSKTTARKPTKTKQTTLFGLAPPTEGKKKSDSKLKKAIFAVDSAEESQTTETQQSMSEDLEETQIETQVETQEDRPSFNREAHQTSEQLDIETEGDPIEWEASPPPSPRQIHVEA